MIQQVMLSMKLIKSICVGVAALALFACAPESDNYDVVHYTCDFEGAYWDALVDSDKNGANLLNGTIARTWHDEKSDLAGAVEEPYTGWWGGSALSNHCSLDLQQDGNEFNQLCTYVESAYSGKNFLICNCFFGGVELSFKSKTSYLESLMVANTTYSYNVVTNGNHIDGALPADKSIWIEAKGYLNGSDEVQATTTFYLYKNGKPAFEGWAEWQIAATMARVDKLVLDIKWDGEGYNTYPAYFALDDIKVVRQELRE